MIVVRIGGSISTTYSLTLSLFYLAHIYSSGAIKLHPHFVRLHNFARPCANAWIQLIQWNRGLIRRNSSWYICRFMTSLQVLKFISQYISHFQAISHFSSTFGLVRVRLSVAQWCVRSTMFTEVVDLPTASSGRPIFVRTTPQFE